MGLQKAKQTMRFADLKTPNRKLRAGHVCRLLRIALVQPAIIAALSGIGASYAQETGAQSKRVEEIIVTARKTEENLQAVPAAISAFPAATLRAEQVQDLGDLQALVPNLSIHSGDASNAVIYIRGVGQIDALAFSDPGVGVYVDDAYLGRTQGAFLDILDVERIEVLRGPQGTLYGRNTIGGAIKYISAKPDDNLEGYVQGSLGNHGRADVRASIGGPIVPGLLAGKLSIARLTRDGYTYNSFANDDDGDRDTLAWSGMLVFHPADDFSARLAIDNSDANPKYSRSPAAESVCCTLASIPPVAPGDDPFKINVNYNTLERTRSRGGSLHLQWQPGEKLSLKSITAARELIYNGELDLDGTTSRVFDVFFNVDQDQFSQEFQLIYDLDALKLVSGYYWFEEDADSFDGVIGPQALDPFVYAGLNENKTESHAVFADLRYTVADTLNLNLGGRWTDETKKFSRTAELFENLAPFPPTSQLIQSDLRDALGTGLNVSDLDDLSNSWDNVSLKAGIDWQHNSGLLLYASVSEGFKSGGFNGRANEVLDPTAALPFQAEEAVSYEAGFKSEWLARSVQLNLTIFHTDYDNLQVQYPTMMALPAFENVGKATIQGAESTAVFIASDALSVHAVLGYLDARIDEFIEEGVDVTDSRQMVNAPEWDGRIGFTYQSALAAGTLRLSSSYSFCSKTYLTISGSELLSQPAYGLWDASVELTSLNQAWQVILGGKNLTDKTYKNHGFDLSGFPGVELGYYGAPRTWSITGRYNF